VFTRQPFAFANNTDVRLRVFQNEANIGLVTIEPSRASGAMIVKSPQQYAYFTAAVDVRSATGRPCRLNYIQVLDRPGK